MYLARAFGSCLVGLQTPLEIDDFFSLQSMTDPCHAIPFSPLASKFDPLLRVAEVFVLGG